MTTLHTAYRVTDLAASLDFYTALGYHEAGRIQSGDGSSLTVLKLPADQVGALELIHRPADDAVNIGTGFGYIVVQVDDIARTVEALSQAGLMPGAPVRHAGQKAVRPHSSQIPTATALNWPSGHLGIRTGSPLQTSAERRTVCGGRVPLRR